MRDYLDNVVELVDLSQNRPLNEIVYEGLRKAIISGIIPVGEHINEKVYAAYMNISRTPMRTAIERLKAEDLLEYIPNYGVVVKRVTETDAIEIYKIRIALDTLASTTAMQLMTTTDKEAMQSLLAETRAANDAHDVKQVVECFRVFNAMIYEYAQMPRLKIVIKQLQEYLARFRDISLLDDDRRSTALHEHEQIFAAIQKQNEDVLVQLIEQHLLDSRNFIIQEIFKDQALAEA